LRSAETAENRTPVPVFQVREGPVRLGLVSLSTVMDPLNCAFVAFDSTIRLITA
jgi:hypothetical protein